MLPSRSSRIDRTLIAETGLIPAGLRLIQDRFPLEVKGIKYAIKEGKGSGGVPVMLVEGLFQVGDTANANDRVYPTNAVLRPAVEEIQRDLGKRSVVGEYDHPPDAKVHLDRVSHLVTGLQMEKRNVYGIAEVLHKLPFGACLRGLFEHKVRVGISSRGVGDMEIMEHNGRQISRVMEGYSFITWDVVAEPSVSGAILNIKEGLNRRLKPVIQKRHILSDRNYQKRLVEEINKFFGMKNL